MLKKLNFWSKSYPNPTPFLGQYDSNHVQCGYVLVQYGHVLSLHLLKKANVRFDGFSKLREIMFFTPSLPHLTLSIVGETEKFFPS